MNYYYFILITSIVDNKKLTAFKNYSNISCIQDYLDIIFYVTEI